MSAERFFDDLARTLAEPMPRRRAVRVIGASLAAIAVPGLSPRMALGASASNHGCGADVRACPRIVNLGTAPPLCCGAPARRYICEGTPANPTCKDTCTTGAPCKSKRKDQDGFSYFNCCKPPEFCPDGECVPNCGLKNPPERQCGKNCCKPGEECRNGECIPATLCGGAPCRSGQKCCPGTQLMPRARCYDPKLECCTPVGGVQPKFPIKVAAWCPDRVRQTNYRPTANGCGPEGGPKVPDAPAGADFKGACDGHDICYGTCRSDKDACDTMFRRQMDAECRQEFGFGRSRLRCLQAAAIYYTGVSKGGADAYEAGQKKACNRCCP